MHKQLTRNGGRYLTLCNWHVTITILLETNSELLNSPLISGSKSGRIWHYTSLLLLITVSPYSDKTCSAKR